MINLNISALRDMSNEEILQELIHRMDNFSKYNLLLGKWNSFEACDGESFAIKIERREV